jgi:hypothetical protein
MRGQTEQNIVRTKERHSALYQSCRVLPLRECVSFASVQCTIEHVRYELQATCDSMVPAPAPKGGAKNHASAEGIGFGLICEDAMRFHPALKPRSLRLSDTYCPERCEPRVEHRAMRRKRLLPTLKAGAEPALALRMSYSRRKRSKAFGPRQKLMFPAHEHAALQYFSRVVFSLVVQVLPAVSSAYPRAQRPHGSSTCSSAPLAQSNTCRLLLV